MDKRTPLAVVGTAARGRDRELGGDLADDLRLARKAGRLAAFEPVTRTEDEIERAFRDGAFIGVLIFVAGVGFALFLNAVYQAVR